MHIALDFDETYTRDPQLWNTFLAGAKERGHTVYCVTMRYDHEAEVVKRLLGPRVRGIYCTGRIAKKKFMDALGINIDVWIDDTPSWIYVNAADAVPDEICEECGCDMTKWTQDHKPGCSNVPY
jgi:hypothetical protein